jgi:hypothetical protein
MKRTTARRKEEITLRDSYLTLISDELSGIANVKTLDAILSFVRIARSREQQKESHV